MAQIVPTITTDNASVFMEKLETFSKFSKRIHVDVSDGSLAPTSLLPLSDINNIEGVAMSIHLMSARPSEHMAEILRIKPALCIVHAEATDNLQEIFTQLHGAGIKAGIALLKNTFPGRARESIMIADHVLIFAGQLGSQGGTIDLLQTEKAPLIRAIKPDVELGWDGGVNLTNVRAVAHSGVDIIDVGSAITNAQDPAAMYQSLVVEAEKKGVLV